MDREEHLKKAREKLKKFQKKKNQCETTTQGSTSRSTPDLDDEASSNKDGGDNNSKRSTPKNEFIDLSQPEMPLPGPSTQPEEETNSLQSQHYTFESSKAMENDPFKSIVPIPANIDVDESSSVSDQIQSILDNSKKQGLSEIVKGLFERKFTDLEESFISIFYLLQMKVRQFLIKFKVFLINQKHKKFLAN